jgi:hypothetical protein
MGSRVPAVLLAQQFRESLLAEVEDRFDVAAHHQLMHQLADDTEWQRILDLIPNPGAVISEVKLC